VKEPQVPTEIAVLKCIKDANPEEQGFAHLYEYGQEPEFSYLVMALLGPNLEQLMRLCGGTFSLKTTMIVSLQVLDRLEVLHGHGYIHGDIAPENFLVGLNNDSPFVFMVDFGRCKRFKNRANGQHIGYKENVHYPYNPVFSSVNAHNNVQASRRDDIESLLYMILYLRLGKLPWAKQTEVAVAPRSPNAPRTSTPNS
jgi:serine/threonine protein kinase